MRTICLLMAMFTSALSFHPSRGNFFNRAMSGITLSQTSRPMAPRHYIHMASRRRGNYLDVRYYRRRCYYRRRYYYLDVFFRFLCLPTIGPPCSMRCLFSDKP